MLKSCFRAARPRRTIKIAAIAAIVCGAVLPGTSARAADTTAPDWLRTAAHETLPEYSKDAVAVVLLDETQTTVKDNGEVENLHRARVGEKDVGRLDVAMDDPIGVCGLEAVADLHRGPQ